MNSPFPYGKIIVFGLMDLILLVCITIRLFYETMNMKDPPETWDRDALLFQIPDGKRLLEIVRMKVYLRRLQ